MEPIFINNLKKRLKQHLPGDIAQNEMRVRTKFPLKNYPILIREQTKKNITSNQELIYLTLKLKQFA